MSPAKAETPVEKSETSDRLCEDLGAGYTQDCGFFKAFVVFIPFCILFWLLVFSVIKALLS